MIKSTIEIEDQEHLLEDIFSAEDKDVLKGRAKYAVKFCEGKTIISITAMDAVAFRAITNSVCKILAVYQKTKEIVYV